MYTNTVKNNSLFRSNSVIWPVVRCFPLYLSLRDKKGNVFRSAYGELAVIRSFCKRGIMKNNYCKLMDLKTATVDHVHKSSTLNIQLIDLREGLFPGV